MNLLRLLFLPLVRAGEQIRDSSSAIRGMLDTMRTSAHCVERSAAVEALRESASQRFERLYRAGGWTEQSLQRQLVAVRRTKWVAIAVCPAGVALSTMMVRLEAPSWLWIVWTPLCACILAYGWTMTLKYTLMQEQLRSRSLISMRELLHKSKLLALIFC